MPTLQHPPYIDLDIDIDRLIRDGVLNKDEADALRQSQQSDTDGAVRMEALPSYGGDQENRGHQESRGDAEERAKDAVKESAVKHKRHWVRTTRLCNQRCTFCLDSMNQDGTMVDTAALKAYILLGKRMGRERLILSGGEASVHPDFFELIKYGRQVGYEWIQTVTNGMMFSYKQFARLAADAGLNEATVSMHGHTAHLHDKLTGTPGAFVTGIKGMQNLIATGKVVVNIDVVVNKQNYKVLPDIIRYYYTELGIREFDLLHIIPFGRGFDEHRHSLFFDLNDAVPYFRKAFEWSKKPGVYLWTNRLPVMYLEGFEKLIQDPHKLHSEFDGGRHNFEGFLKRGLKPDCFGERCDYCFLDGPCRTTMFPYRAHLEAGTFPQVRLDSRHVWQGPEARAAFERQRPQRVMLTARDAEDAKAAMARLSFANAPVTVQLDAGADPRALYAYTGTAVRAAAAGAGGTGTDGKETGLTARVQRFVVTTVDDAARYLVGAHAVPAPAEVEVRLTRDLASWLLARPATVKAFAGRLVAALQVHEYMSESVAVDPEPAQLTRLAKTGIRLKNTPKCVARAEVEPHDHMELDAGMFDGAGALDLDRYVAHYVENEYFAKSIRCGRCAEFDNCRGMQINYLRNHGFGILSPLDEAGMPLADAASFDGLTGQLAEATAARGKRDQQRLLGLHKPVDQMSLARHAEAASQV